MFTPLGAAEARGELDDLLQSSFDLVADATCALSGFEVVSLLVRSQDALCCVAVAGSEAARTALLGSRLTVAEVDGELRHGERHGLWVFLPASPSRSTVLDDHAWFPPIEASEDPARWHPEDTLLAPLLTDDGQLMGVLGVDVPADGRRPTRADWDRLQVYAEQARDALLIALDRDRAAHQLKDLESARAVIRDLIHDPEQRDDVDGEGPLEPVLRRVAMTLSNHFGVDAAWFHLFPGADRAAITLDGCGPRPLPFEHAFAPYGEEIAQALWNGQVVGVVGREERLNVDESNLAAVELADSYLGENDIESMLLAPLGMGPECLGLLILIRAAGARSWSEAERDAMVDIGRDLGALVAGVFARRRDVEILADLRALEAYKSQMVDTVSHELKNPLAAIRSNTELLHDTRSPEEAAHLLAAVRRSAHRMAAIVSDLQSLAAADSAPLPEPTALDLGDLARTVSARSADVAAQRQVRILLRLASTPVIVRGEAVELDRLLENLVSNAVKYSHRGGEVHVTVGTDGPDAVLTIADEGIGITAADQQRLFDAFFRSRDPAVLAEPGTGLGLAIVRRIVERHDGRIEVRSRPGEGSTFCVRLPREVAS